MEDGRRKKILVISAFVIDSESGSEPFIAHEAIVEATKYFERILIVTSSLTRISEIQRNHQSTYTKVEFIQVPFEFDGIFDFRFYIKYRNWQKNAGVILQKAVRNIETKNIMGLHISLSTFLFGSCFAGSGIPYIYGPAGFSIFHLRFSRLYGIKTIGEILRNMLALFFLCFDWRTRKSIIQSSAVVPVNQGNEAILLKLFRRSTNVVSPIPHSALPEMETISVEKTTNIVWVGRLIPRKFPMAALEIFSVIAKSDKAVKLIICGDGPLRGSLLAAVDKHDFRNRIVYKGWLEKHDLSSEISKASLLLMTSIRETAGNQIVESMKLGTHVVAMDSSGLRKYIKTPSVIFIPIKLHESKSDIFNKFGQACLDILSRNKNLLQDEVIQGQKESKKYEMRTIFQQIISLI
jgi:glycosyltransferase involved in cell wall biosynthesis